MVKVIQRDATTGRLKEVDVGDNSEQIEADEAIAAFDLVEVFDDAGTPKIRKASAAAADQRTAIGFVDAAYVATDIATVFFEGRVTGAGFTPGDRIYLSTSVQGDVQTTVPTGTGNFHQFVGKAISATEFNFEPDDPIELL